MNTDKIREWDAQVRHEMNNDLVCIAMEQGDWRIEYARRLIALADTEQGWSAYAKTCELTRAAQAGQQHGIELGRAMAQDEKVEGPVATLHDDGFFTWKCDELRRKYDRQQAGWRMDVFASPQHAPDTARLVVALAKVGNHVAWHNFGDCRAFDEYYKGPPLTARQAYDAVVYVLKPYLEK